MASGPISHTKHDVPGSPGVWRPGSTSHEESGTDLLGYLRPLEQAHARSLHGPGVATGMTLTAAPGSSTVRIGPGVAVDPAGRHIVLAAGGFAEASETPDVSSLLIGVTAEGVDVPTAGRTGPCVVTVAWRETFDRQLLEDSFQQKFLERQTPWVRIQPPGDAAAGPGVVLGTVELEDGVVAAGGVGTGTRRGPLPTVEGLQLSRAAVGTDGMTTVAAGELRARPDRGLGLGVAVPGAPLEIRADRVAFAGSDGTERVTVDARSGRLGLGTTGPSHALHATATTGIRQNRLYLSGFGDWSSLSYNAHHNDANSGWVFPEPSRSAVTIEIDDSGGTPRFDVWSTTPAAPTDWNLRLRIDGASGRVSIPGSLSVDGRVTTTSLSATGISVDRSIADTVALTATNHPGNAICAMSNDGVALRAVGGNLALGVIGPSSFAGAVDVGGTLTATEKRFVIDHPLDPENRTLAHVSVESDERATVYSGKVALDDDGGATVPLADWMETLNTDFRYQLTCVGRAAAVYVAREVSEGSFAIAGGEAGMTVSWQLTGVRRDEWARENPFVVEEDKPEAERGSFRHPEPFGQERSRSVHYVRNEHLLHRLPQVASSVLREGYGTGRAY